MTMLSKIEDALKDLENGKMLIVVDDENRENEGDFIMPAQNITAADVNFMATHGRGLICAPVSERISKKLGLPLMIERSEDSMQTAFTVSVDAKNGVSTGISAMDRALTLRLLADPAARPSEFTRPGHIFPLIAKDRGVLVRAGHTEAAVDLAILSGHNPVGVICEILAEDGSAARMPELEKLAKKHHLKIISIEDLVDFKLRHSIDPKEVYAGFGREFNIRL